MPKQRLTEIIAQLPFEKKVVGIGSVLMLIGLFFPWYQDLDTFRTGDTFTGLTGPLYFAGFTFLLIASGSLLVMVMDYLDKTIPVFKVKAANVHLWSGIASFYLLFLVGSVYFHPAFGLNITLKQSGFGMFIAYAAAALLTIGGYLEGRGRSAVKMFEKETREEPVKQQVQQPVVEERKPRENLRNMQYSAQIGQRHQKSLEVESDLQKQQAVTPVPQPVIAHGSVASSLSEQEPVTQASSPVAPPARSAVSDQPERKTQPYRMDL